MFQKYLDDAETNTLSMIENTIISSLKHRLHGKNLVIHKSNEYPKKPKLLNKSIMLTARLSSDYNHFLCSFNNNDFLKGDYVFSPLLYFFEMTGKMFQLTQL